MPILAGVRIPREQTLELAKQDAAELLDAGRRVVERGENGLSFGDLEGEYAHLAVGSRPV